MKWDIRRGQNTSNPSIRVPRQHRRKRTGQWCRGRKGFEHEPEVVQWQGLPCRFVRVIRPAEDYVLSCWHAVVCSDCGKQLDTPDTCPDQPHWLGRTTFRMQQNRGRK